MKKKVGGTEPPSCLRRPTQARTGNQLNSCEDRLLPPCPTTHLLCSASPEEIPAPPPPPPPPPAQGHPLTFPLSLPPLPLDPPRLPSPGSFPISRVPFRLSALTFSTPPLLGPGVVSRDLARSPDLPTARAHRF
jgi:hypothetical protein